jgi:hypothetical protein
MRIKKERRFTWRWRWALGLGLRMKHETWPQLPAQTQTRTLRPFRMRLALAGKGPILLTLSRNQDQAHLFQPLSPSRLGVKIKRLEWNGTRTYWRN